MFHSDTQILIDTWTALGEAAVIPDRAAFDPTRLGLLLPRAFMAVRRGDGAEFRLAGSWIETFHGDRLAGTAWLPWWSDSSRPLVADAITRTFREARPVVIVAGAGTDETALEIVLTPLRGADGVADRILGLYAPTTAETRHLLDVDSLTARVSVGVGDIRRAPLSLATVDGRLIA
ncbi:MAG: PAS domain-containing protein [Brevundimonas sp.]